MKQALGANRTGRKGPVGGAVMRPSRRVFRGGGTAMKKLSGMLLGFLAALATPVGLGAVMVLVLGLTAPSAAYAAPSFNFITIDVSGDPGILTEAFGINFAGKIVGAAYTPTWEDYVYDVDGFLW